MPLEKPRDMMRRTMFNLRFIEQHASDRNGPYEVTQLINSFLGAMAHPWEEYLKSAEDLPWSAAEGWPPLGKDLAGDEGPNHSGRHSVT